MLAVDVITRIKVLPPNKYKGEASFPPRSQSKQLLLFVIILICKDICRTDANFLNPFKNKSLAILLIFIFRLVN